MTKENQDTKTKEPLSKSELEDLLFFLPDNSKREFCNKANELNAETLIEATKKFKEQATGKKRLILGPTLTIIAKK